MSSRNPTTTDSREIRGDKVQYSPSDKDSLENSRNNDDYHSNTDISQIDSTLHDNDLSTVESTLHQHSFYNPRIEKSSLDYEIESSLPVDDEAYNLDSQQSRQHRPSQSQSQFQSQPNGTSFTQQGSFADFEDADFDMEAELAFLERNAGYDHDMMPPDAHGPDRQYAMEDDPYPFPEDDPFFTGYERPTTTSTTTTSTSAHSSSTPSKRKSSRHSNAQEDEIDPDLAAYLSGRVGGGDAGVAKPEGPSIPPTKRVRISLGKSASLISGGPSSAATPKKQSSTASTQKAPPVARSTGATAAQESKPSRANHSFILPDFLPGTANVLIPPHIVPGPNLEPVTFQSERAFKHAEQLLGIADQDIDMVDSDLQPYKEYLAEPRVFPDERGWGTFAQVGDGRHRRFLLVESYEQKKLRLRAKERMVLSALNSIDNDNSILSRKSRQLEEIARHQQQLEEERLRIEHENEIAEQSLRMQGEFAKQQTSLAGHAASAVSTVHYEPTPVKGAGKKTPKHAKKEKSSMLFVDKYAPFNYASLLSPETTNREAIHWLVQWNGIVFGKNAVVLTAKQRQFERHLLQQQQQAQREGGGGKGSFQRESQSDTSNSGGGAQRRFLSWNDPQSVQKYGPHKKILLLCGPPGCGKTTLAHIIAKQCGYRVSEINASDDRGGEVARTKIINAIENQSLHGSSTPTCLILDEIDGASGADGSFEESAPSSVIDLLLKIAKDATLYDQTSFQFEQDQLESTTTTTPGKKGADDAANKDKSLDDGKQTKQTKGKQLLRPIICICNNIQAPALRPLLHYAKVLHLQTIDRLRLVNRLKAIAYRENIRYESRFLATLADRLTNDVRSCLHALQFMSIKTPARHTPRGAASFATPVKKIKTMSRVQTSDANHKDTTSHTNNQGEPTTDSDETEILRVSDLAKMRLGQKDTSASVTMLTDIILGLKSPSTPASSAPSSGGSAPSDAKSTGTSFLPKDLSTFQDSSTDLLSTLTDNSATPRVMEQIFAMYPLLTGVTSNLPLITQIIDVISTYYYQSTSHGEYDAIYPFLIQPLLVSTITLVRYNHLHRELPSTRLAAMTNLHVISQCRRTYAMNSLVMYNNRDMVMEILPSISMLITPRDIVSQSWKALTPTEVTIFQHVIRYMSYFHLKYHYQTGYFGRQQHRPGQRMPGQMLLDPNIDGLVCYDLQWTDTDPLSSLSSSFGNKNHRHGSSASQSGSKSQAIVSHINSRVIFIPERPKPLPYAIKEALTREVDLFIFKEQMRKENEVRSRIQQQQQHQLDGESSLEKDNTPGRDTNATDPAQSRDSRPKQTFMTEEDAVEQMLQVTEKYRQIAQAVADQNVTAQKAKPASNRSVGSLRGFLTVVPSTTNRAKPAEEKDSDETEDTSISIDQRPDHHNTHQPQRHDVSQSRSAHTLQLIFFEGFSNAVKKPVSMDMFL